MLFKTLARAIQTAQRAHQTNTLLELSTKVDLFYALGKLTEDEYIELTGMFE